MVTFFRIFLIVTISLNLFDAFGQSKLLIKNVTIIEPQQNKILKSQNITIENGIIKTIENYNAQKKNSTKSYIVIDGTGKYLLPGFTDAHAHLPDSSQIASYFWMQLLNGVTTLRSMRGEAWHLALRENISKKKIVAPKLFLSPPPITRKDTFNINRAIELMSRYSREGYDFVKILSVKNTTTFDIIVDAARKGKIPLAGHCPPSVGIFNVIDTHQFLSLEHLGGFIELGNNVLIDSAVQLSNKANLYHCATLDWYYLGQVSEDTLRKKDGVQYLSKELVKQWEEQITKYYSENNADKRSTDREKSKSSFNDRLKCLEHIYNKGAKLLISPDASGIYSIPGFDMHTEMELYKRANIATIDIMKAACFNLAEMMGQVDRWGSVRVGLQSDLVLLEKNPLENIENSKYVAGVVVQGKFLTRSFMEDHLKTLLMKK